MTAIADTTVKAPPRTLTERLVRIVGRSPVHIILGLIALVWLVPTIGLLITSFRPAADMRSTGWWTTLFERTFTLENYQRVISDEGMGQAFLNTIFITIPSTLLPLIVASMAAFALAWIKFPFRDTIFLLIVALLIVPVQVGFIPLVTAMSGTPLLVTYGAIWLAHTAYALPFGIFLLRNFFITLPKDLIEAARIDGASNWMIFRTIVVPLSVPAIAAYGIFQFLWVWNDLLMALIYVQSNALQPMPFQVNSLLGTYATEWSLLSAAAFLVMVVPLIVFISLQRFFVQGLLAGSVK
ncbi:MAG TPA: carbohydrate ABC transporter permease [Candidatus Limnocylindria bacterium]